MSFARPRIEGTGRVEAFSDGVIAIIVTLLIFEVRSIGRRAGGCSTRAALPITYVVPSLLSRDGAA